MSNGSDSARASYSDQDFKVVATSQGEWGNGIKLTVADAGQGEYDLTVTYAESDMGCSFDVTAADFLGKKLSTQPALVRLAVSSDQLGNGADGGVLTTPTLPGDPSARTGIYALHNADIFNLLCIPPAPFESGSASPAGADIDMGVLQAAAEYCSERRAMLVLDPLQAWADDVHQDNIEAISPTGFMASTSHRRRTRPSISRASSRRTSSTESTRCSQRAARSRGRSPRPI